MTTVARKNGIQTFEATSMQSHMDSIHSPHNTRKTIMNECMKSTKFQRGISLKGNLSVLSAKKQAKVKQMLWNRTLRRGAKKYSSMQYLYMYALGPTPKCILHISKKTFLLLVSNSRQKSHFWCHLTLIIASLLTVPWTFFLLYFSLCYWPRACYGALRF